MLESITSKAGLIGYLEGSLKVISAILSSKPEEERTYEEKRVLAQVTEALKTSNEAWLKVKKGVLAAVCTLLNILISKQHSGKKVDSNYEVICKNL